ncbi:MAG: hypothetical protein ACRC1M_01505 [Methanobacteriaceae archaeon]
MITAYNIFNNPSIILNIETLTQFLLPIILTTLLLPFIYFLGLYMKYELFYKLQIIRIKNKKLERYTIIKLFKKCHFNIYFLNKFSKNLRFYNGASKEYIDNQFSEADEKLNK